MVVLNDKQVSYVQFEIEKRGVVYAPVKDEFVDHICCEVEKAMDSGRAFIDAFENVIKEYPVTRIKKIQWNTYHETNSKTRIMFKNYLKIAWRSLNKNRFYSGINIVGFAIGLACCLLILLFVQDEITYDRFNTKSDKIYRIGGDIVFGGNEFKMAVTSEPLGRTLVEDYSFVESTVRFRNRGAYIVQYQDKSFRETAEKITFTDSTFFDIFTVPLIKGNPSKALSKPDKIAISERCALKYFGTEDPIGKILKLDGQREVEVSAVYENIPENSHFHFDMLVSLTTIKDGQEGVWLSNNYHTYILTTEGTTAADVDAVMPEMLQRYAGPQIENAIGKSLDEFNDSGNRMRYFAQPLEDIHLHSNLDHELEANGDIQYVYVFSAIALFILGIACINFMNLSTARSANRAKEVGVRKVLGSYRSHLIRQFLTESVIMTLLAAVLSLGIAYLAMPFFNDLASKELSVPFHSISFLGILFSVAVLVGILAGFYPAFFLSAFKPIAVLKGKLNLGTKSGWVRSALVVSQFVISIFLIVGTLVIYEQMNFIMSKKLGFSKDQILVLNDTYMFRDNVESFRNELENIAGIESVTMTGFIPVEKANRNDTGFWLDGKEITDENMISMQYWFVDQNYIKTMGMQLSDGRNFNKDLPSDSTVMILNEQAIKMFGIEDFTKEKVMTWDGMPDQNGEMPKIGYNIIGVIEDFHYESMKKDIGPLALVLGNNTSKTMVKLSSADAHQVVGNIEKLWKSIIPDVPMGYTFMDSEFDAMYKTESRMMQVFGVFSSLCIFIACLGLFGLASFTAQQRTKEIGVRKVLGASISSIVLLLSKEFGKLIMISFVLAIPISWYAMNQWLMDFEYKINIGLGIFVVAGSAAFLVAWFTMSLQTIKAATANPVDSLKDD